VHDETDSDFMSNPALDGVLLLEFDNPDPQFALGFECGRIWALLRGDPGAELSEYVHVTNLEMLLRLAEATGRTVRTEDVDETWVLATFAPALAVESELF
jgi:hypothetical protein